MSISQEALKQKPKKPLNGYFKFRGEKLKELKEQENRVALVKEEWENLDPKIRAKMDLDYKADIEQWKNDIEAWEKKFGITKEDKKRSKSKERSSPKPEKSKGTKDSGKEKKEEKKGTSKDNKDSKKSVSKGKKK